jgi:hypothetical protein
MVLQIMTVQVRLAMSLAAVATSHTAAETQASLSAACVANDVRGVIIDRRRAGAA